MVEKVFVLMRQFYDDCELVEIFESRTGAVRYIEQVFPDYCPFGCDANVYHKDNESPSLRISEREVLP